MTVRSISATSYFAGLTRYSIYALLIFTPLARASVQGWAITTIHLVTLIALAAFLLEKSITWNWEWIKTPLDKPIIFLLALCVLSSIFSLHKVASLWALILLLNYITIYYLVIHTTRTRAQFRQLVYLIIGIAAFLAIFGLIKRFGTNPFPWWDYHDLKHTANRLSSTFGNADHLAGYMEMTIPLALGLTLIGLAMAKRLLLFLVALLLFTALLLTISRGGYFSLFIALLFMAIALMTNRHFKNKKAIVVIAFGFLVVGMFALTSTNIIDRIGAIEELHKTPNFKARVIVWGGIVNVIRDYPLLGTGPGTFSYAFTQYQPPGFLARYFYGHNDYLHFISETGIPLIPVIVWMIIAFYRKGFRKLKNPSRLVRGITVGAMSGITAILIHSIADFNLHIPANAILFTVLAALITAPLPQHNRSTY